MARYIDADKTIELLKSLGSRDYRREKGTICDAIKMLQHSEYTPTADVVPRAEIESLLDKLIEEAGKIADGYKKEADETGISDYAKAEYRGTQIGALLVQYRISNLKKKYTEGGKE